MCLVCQNSSPFILNEAARNCTISAPTGHDSVYAVSVASFCDLKSSFYQFYQKQIFIAIYEVIPNYLKATKILARAII